MSYDENRISDLIDGGLEEEKQQQEAFKKVLNTLKANKVMVKLMPDGIYTRLAGSEGKGEAFTLSWANSYPFQNQKR